MAVSRDGARAPLLRRHHPRYMDVSHAVASVQTPLYGRWRFDALIRSRTRRGACGDEQPVSVKPDAS
jgi:hypothetical protein